MSCLRKYLLGSRPQVSTNTSSNSTSDIRQPTALSRPGPGPPSVTRRHPTPLETRPKEQKSVPKDFDLSHFFLSDAFGLEHLSHFSTTHKRQHEGVLRTDSPSKLDPYYVPVTSTTGPDLTEENDEGADSMDHDSERADKDIPSFPENKNSCVGDIEVLDKREISWSSPIGQEHPLLDEESKKAECNNVKRPPGLGIKQKVKPEKPHIQSNVNTQHNIDKKAFTLDFMKHTSRASVKINEDFCHSQVASPNVDEAECDINPMKMIPREEKKQLDKPNKPLVHRNVNNQDQARKPFTLDFMKHTYRNNMRRTEGVCDTKVESPNLDETDIHPMKRLSDGKNKQLDINPDNPQIGVHRNVNNQDQTKKTFTLDFMKHTYRNNVRRTEGVCDSKVESPNLDEADIHPLKRLSDGKNKQLEINSQKLISTHRNVNNQDQTKKSFTLDFMKHTYRNSERRKDDLCDSESYSRKHLDKLPSRSFSFQKARSHLDTNIVKGSARMPDSSTSGYHSERRHDPHHSHRKSSEKKPSLILPTESKNHVKPESSCEENREIPTTTTINYRSPTTSEPSSNCPLVSRTAPPKVAEDPLGSKDGDKVDVPMYYESSTDSLGEESDSHSVFENNSLTRRETVARSKTAVKRKKRRKSLNRVEDSESDNEDAENVRRRSKTRRKGSKSSIRKSRHSRGSQSREESGGSLSQKERKPAKTKISKPDKVIVRNKRQPNSNSPSENDTLPLKMSPGKVKRGRKRKTSTNKSHEEKGKKGKLNVPLKPVCQPKSSIYKREDNKTNNANSIFALSEMDHAWNSVLPISDLMEFEKQLHKNSRPSDGQSSKSYHTPGFSSIFGPQTHPGGVWQSIVEED